jgi:hypothetical protein
MGRDACNQHAEHPDEPVPGFAVGRGTREQKQRQPLPVPVLPRRQKILKGAPPRISGSPGHQTQHQAHLLPPRLFLDWKHEKQMLQQADGLSLPSQLVDRDRMAHRCIVPCRRSLIPLGRGLEEGRTRLIRPSLEKNGLLPGQEETRALKV